MSDFTSDVPSTSVADPSKRVRYSTGLVLGVDEFEQEQAYFVERDRLLTRALHGYGVVHGLEVRIDTSEDAPRLMVEPGLGVTPSGQHVCIDQAQCAVIPDWLARQQAEDHIPEGDASAELCTHVVLRYGTCATDVVPVPGEPCRSAEESRVASRLADDFTLTFEFDADRPPQVEEGAARLLGEVLRALDVRPTETATAEGDVAAMVEAIPAVLSSLDDPLSATVSDLASEAGVSVPSHGDGTPYVPVAPDGDDDALRQIQETWVTHVRPQILVHGHDEDPLRAGTNGRHACQPVPHGDDGLVLGTLCVDVTSRDDGTLQVDESGAGPSVNTRLRSLLTASRILKEGWTGVRRDRPTGGDGMLDGAAAGGDLTGTYPNPEVAGLRNEPLSMDPGDSSLSLSDGHVLTYDGTTWRPEPLPDAQTPPEPEPAPTNAESDLTRILALNWDHDTLFSEPEPLTLSLEGYDGDLSRGIALAFGAQSSPPEPGTVLEAPEDGVLSTTLNAETVRLYAEWSHPDIPGMNHRMRLHPGDLVHLRTVQIGDRGLITGGQVDTLGGIVRGVAYLFPPEALSRIDAEAITIDVEVRGDFIQDDREKAIDAEFVRAGLPTGDRPAGGDMGVQGGRFESWFYLRAEPSYVRAGSSSGGDGGQPDLEIVDLNAAGLDALVRLPGVGDTIAERIIEFREGRDAPIESPFDLTGVSGLTRTQIEEWAGRVEPPVEPPQ